MLDTMSVLYRDCAEERQAVVVAGRGAFVGVRALEIAVQQSDGAMRRGRSSATRLGGRRGSLDDDEVVRGKTDKVSGEGRGGGRRTTEGGSRGCRERSGGQRKVQSGQERRGGRRTATQQRPAED